MARLSVNPLRLLSIVLSLSVDIRIISIQLFSTFLNIKRPLSYSSSGADRFLEDIEMMLGSSPGRFWKFSWMFIVPIILGLTIISYFISHTPPTLGDYNYPPWAQMLAWVITLFPLMIILVYFSYMFCRQGGFEVSTCRISFNQMALCLF